MTDVEEREDGYYVNGIGPCASKTEALFMSYDPAAEDWS